MRFFVPNGLPLLVVIDEGRANKGALLAMCKLLLLDTHVVSPGNHRALRVERFFRYLNKVDRINTATLQSFAMWLQGIFFAIYGHNSSPVDGTNIIRSFAAKGRTFPFPLDLALGQRPVTSGREGTAALLQVEAMAPILQKQRLMLSIINKERRERHRELRNEGKKQRHFDIGDIVLVRRQVLSSSEKGIAAKQVFKATGPFIVVEERPPASYMVRKLPFTEGAGNPGIPRKANSAEMELLPSTLYVYKRVDGADVRFGGLDATAVHNPLEPALRGSAFWVIQNDV